MNNIAPIKEAFKSATRGHRMEVLLDHGLYKHLRFRAPNTGTHGFDLVTIPGQLTITGDMGTYVFKRSEDMFAWFADSKGINPGYWGEKVIAADRLSGIRTYAPDTFRQAVRDLAVEFYEDADMDEASAFGLALEVDVLAYAEDEQEAREALASFVHEGFRFVDTGELDFTEYTHRFLWCCYAIQWGIRQHRNATVLKAAA